MYYLIVISAFSSYVVGTIITDPGTIAAILAGPYRSYVTKIAGSGGGSTTESIAVSVTQALVGSPIVLAGQVANGSPSALDYSVDGGSTWAAVNSYALSGTNWSGTGPTYTSTQAGSIIVRDHAQTGIQSEPTSFAVKLPGGSGNGTLVLADGSGITGVGTGLSAGTTGAPAALAVQFGTVTGTVGDGGVLAATQAAVAAALPLAGGTMAAGATISSSTSLTLAPTSQLWLGPQSGAGAVYSATIAGVTALPTVASKLWNNGGVVAVSNGGTLAPNPTFAPTHIAAQPWADVAGSAGIFSHNAGLVPTPPAAQAGLLFGDRAKLAGPFNFAEVWPTQNTAQDAWPTLQNYLLYAQLMYLAQKGTSLDNVAQRAFVDVFLPAGDYLVAQPLVVPENVRLGGPGRILRAPYQGTQSAAVAGPFASNWYLPTVIVVPRAHLSDLNIYCTTDGVYAHRGSGVCMGKNWQAQPQSACTIGAAGSGYVVGDLIVAANPSPSPYSGFVAQVTAINGSGGVTAAQIYQDSHGNNYGGAYALPPTAGVYNSATGLQATQWTAANGFSVFDGGGNFLQAKTYHSDFATPGAGTGATLTPVWQPDFAAGANQYQCGDVGITCGSQAGRIQITGAVPDQYDTGGEYGPTYNVMLSGLEFEIDSIQGLGGHAGLWATGAQDVRINRLNFVETNIFAWFHAAGSIECANCVADTCGCVLVIDQSHGIRMHGRAFFEEGNIVSNGGPINSQGAAFLIGKISSSTYPNACLDIKFTVINMGGLPQSTITAKSLTPYTATQQAACASLAYLVSSIIDLTVSNYSQYGAAGGSPYPNPSPLPTSGIYQINYGVDPGNVLRGSLDTVPTIDGVTPTGALAAIVTSTSGQGIRQKLDVWDGLHSAEIGPCGVASIYGSGAPTNGTSGTGAGYAPPTSTYRDQASGITYRNTGTKTSPVWTTP